MKKILLVVALMLTLGQGDNMKPKINFNKDGKLMWLIDTTDINRDYSLDTISEIKLTDPDLIHYSYESYLNHVNTHKEYKYTNWRLPTKEELLTLELKDTFFARLFVSSEQKKKQICINTEIFYDHEIRHIDEYWTSDACISGSGKDGYVSVDFNALRFDPKSYLKASPAWGISYGCTPSYGKYNVRFVRDLK